jgi:hypothetical protein
MADIQTGKLPKLGERLDRAVDSQQAAGASTLTCQWCSVALQPGVTICPTCGSAGVPDASMVVPDIPLEIDEPAQLSLAVEPASDPELPEWWNEGEETGVYRNTAEEGHDPLPVILGLVGTGVVCILLGVLVAPTLLASVFENSLGVTVENNNDLRPLGGVLGLLTAAFIGALGIWVAGPRR